MIYKLIMSYTVLKIALKLKIYIQKKRYSNPFFNTEVTFLNYTADIKILLHKNSVLWEIRDKGIQPLKHTYTEQGSKLSVCFMYIYTHILLKIALIYCTYMETLGITVT
jgi:hypothetical protein